MHFLAGRLESVRRPMTCSLIFLFAQLVAACGPDSPGPVSPTAGSVTAPSLGLLNFSNGPITADVKSVRGNGACLTVRGGVIADGKVVEVQPVHRRGLAGVPLPVER